MRVTPQLAVVTLLAMCLYVPVVAETELEVSGQVRARTEADKKDFDPDATSKSFTDLRTRAKLEALVDENTEVVVQLQDSRRLGGQDASGDDNSGTLNNASNVDVHQAYLHIRELWENGFGLKAGRFEVAYGGQRLFGSVGWSNVGRSWEGMKLTLKRPNYSEELFWLKRRELNSSFGNTDFDILGIHSDFKTIGLQLLVFYEYDGKEIVHSSGLDNTLDRINFSAYFKREFERLTLEANGVYQTGKQVSRSFMPPLRQDINAFLITVEGRLVVDPDQKAWVGAGVDFASGDSDPSDDDFKSYNNLYYTGHKFRGHMDYFIPSRAEGLIDIFVRGSITPVEGWTLSADVHHFMSHQDYMGTGGNLDSDVGVEIDLYAKTTKIKGAVAQIGVSAFEPATHFAGSDADTGLWGYLMFTANFGAKVK